MRFHQSVHIAFDSGSKYKHFLADVMNVQNVSYKYMVSSSYQLLGYTENVSIGRAGSPPDTRVDASAFSGIAWYGKMYAGTIITIKGVRA